MKKIKEWLNTHKQIIADLKPIGKLLTILFLGYLLLQFVYPILTEILNKNFSTTELLNFLIILFLIIISTITLIYWTNFYSKPNIWTLLTIFLIGITLVSGLILIDNYHGAKTLEIHLRNTTGVKIDVLNCTSPDNIDVYSDKQLLTGEKIICKSNSLNLTEPITLLFILDNNSKIEINSLNFEAPANVKRIEFSGTCLQNNNNEACSTGHNYKFLSLNENETRKNNFLNSLILLITTSLFAIPAAMLNFRKLWRNEP